MPELVAAVTAGGRVDGAFAARIGTEVKALAPWRDGTLLDAAIAAARGAGATKVAVVGPAAVLERCEGLADERIPERATGEENLRAALESAGGDALLFLTSDMPFVDAAAAIAFLERARGADIAMPLAEIPDYEAAFPGSPPHVTTIGSERVAGGSTFYFGPGVAPQVQQVATRLFTARKSVWAMARLLGPALLALFALRRLRIEDVERRAEHVFGLRARAVRNAPPELCYDVDSLEDYEYALERAGRG